MRFDDFVSDLDGPLI